MRSQAGMLSLGPELALSYTERGDPRGPAVILLHGYSDSWPSYMPLMAELPSSFRVIALTMRGHGDSSKPTRSYDTKTFAEDVIAALDSLGIAEAAIVGHSMGSLVAERIALDHPHRVTTLILIGAFATLKANAAAEAVWRTGVAGMRDPIDPAFVQAFQESSLAVPVAADFLDAVVADSLKVPAYVWVSTLRALLDEDHSSRLSEISAPMMIIWGDQDIFAGRAEQEFLALTIPNAHLSIHAGIGHAPHWENPGRVAAELIAFINMHRRFKAPIPASLQTDQPSSELETCHEHWSSGICAFGRHRRSRRSLRSGRRCLQHLRR